MKKCLTFLGILMISLSSSAQRKQEIENYIAKYKDIALEEMVRCGIPASITLAQGIHESGCGKSPLSKEANNHFGIKCKDEWNGKKYYLDDDQPNECFRVYEHAEASYADHSDFLVTRARYADLFKLSMTDYKGWANGLKAFGYATNPKYAQLLIAEIEEYHLYDLDQTGLAMLGEKEKLLAYSEGQEPFLAKLEAKVFKAIKPKTPNPEVERIAKKESNRTEYVVNGLPALIAKPNEDPLKVSFDYEIDYSHILSFNDLATGEHFKGGENIFLQAKKGRGEEAKYTVRSGESLRDVSQKFGIKLNELYLKNQMKPNEQVYAGEILYLKERRSSRPRTMTYAEFLKSQDISSARLKNKTPRVASRKFSINTTGYKVQPMDTLSSIARKFNTTVQELQSLNNLQTTKLKEGQNLIVSK